MRRVIYILKVWALASVALFMGCDSVTDEADVLLSHNECEHTIVMYLTANNNLSSSIYQNALDAEKGMIGAPPSTRLIIYLDTAAETKLYEVSYLSYGAEEYMKRCKVLKTYPTQTSTTPEVMKGVMEDIKKLAPSRTYGLVLAGHGTGWFPKPSSGVSYDKQKVAPIGGREYYFNHTIENPQTRAMGYDYVVDENGSSKITDESYISTQEIVEGLSPIHFDYVIFDACFMSSVEFLYDVRGIADYIIASPVEILACGMPYNEVVGNLASVRHDVSQIGEIVMDVYMRDNEFTREKSLALATIDCSKLEQLADVVADIYASTGGEDCVETLEERVNKDNVQVLDRMSPAGFYDLEDFVLELTDDAVLQQQFLDALDDVLVGVVHTEGIYSLGYNKEGDYYDYDYITGPEEGPVSLCGISTYIPHSAAPMTNGLYQQTSWAKKIYGE